MQFSARPGVLNLLLSQQAFYSLPAEDHGKFFDHGPRGNWKTRFIPLANIPVEGENA
jgi:hypothetical protein